CQLRRGLDNEQHAGRLRSDNTTEPTWIVDQAAAELTQAGHAAQDLTTHSTTHTSSWPTWAPPPNLTAPINRARSNARPAPVTSHDRALATAGQKRWPPVGTL